ncbi:MAG: hypothetical protein GF346_00935 [Candidatus Eisenbacteria bacterium]|nr:hypothetical protein [Candidatus Latescibacterota bacterium]MBD3300997.1 hypothetical protein [Candidatus Eisenbacteria bacterium]
MQLGKGLLCVYGLLSILLIFSAIQASHVTAYPSIYDAECAGCHGGNRTCDGCHMHRGNIAASADQDSYEPGALVTITLTGGREGGWIGAFLYDDAGTEIDHVSNSGFPVQLHAAAPEQPGDYEWSAAWRGNDNGAGHVEIPRTVTVVVTEPPAGIEEGDPPSIHESWGRMKSRYGR